LPLEEFNSWRVSHDGECDWSTQPDATPALSANADPRLLANGNARLPER
jgi:hypothetical protein